MYDSKGNTNLKAKNPCPKKGNKNSYNENCKNNDIYSNNRFNDLSINNNNYQNQQYSNIFNNLENNNHKDNNCENEVNKLNDSITNINIANNNPINDCSSKKSSVYNSEEVTTDVITFDNGYVYEGELKHNIFEGKGKYYNSKNPNICYYGDWKQGLKSGIGREMFEDGSVYEGEFSNGKQNGKGKLILSDGKIFIGDFVNGNIKGQGKFTYSEDSYYEGEWDNNFFNGFGCLYSKNKKFIGYFNDNKKNGLGFVYMYDSQTFLLGRWENNKGMNFFISGSEPAGIEVFIIGTLGKKEVLSEEKYINNSEFFALKEFFNIKIKTCKYIDCSMKIKVNI